MRVFMSAGKPTTNSKSRKKTKKKIKEPTGLSYLIGRADRAISRQISKKLAPFGLTIRHYTALSIFRTSGTLSNAKLAERTMVSPQAANDLIKMMEKSGWIVREPDPNHGRIIQIQLTKEGKQLLTRCNKAIAELELEIFDGISDKDIDVLKDHLRHAIKKAH